MKKFITLLFFAGLFTTAFAQPGSRQKNKNQSNPKDYASPENSGRKGDQYSRGNRNNDGGYQDDGRNKRHDQHDHAYQKDRGNKDRDGMRRDRRDHYDYSHNHHNRFEHDSYGGWHRRYRMPGNDRH